jgi:hypothetical protein
MPGSGVELCAFLFLAWGGSTSLSTEWRLMAVRLCSLRAESFVLRDQELGVTREQ